VAVERPKSRDDAVALSQEPGVHLVPSLHVARSTDQLDPGRCARGVAAAELAGVHTAQGSAPVEELWRLLAEKTMEVGFYQRCMAKTGRSRLGLARQSSD
jgi:hypothetical protein